MSAIKVRLATESHPSCDHHYVFSAECLDRFAEQATGMPVTLNFGRPIGVVRFAKRETDGVALEIDLMENVSQRVASPAFTTRDSEWSDDSNERLIRCADLNGIGLTDD